MKLKELRLYGFKSFPQKTVLELSAGMTALVGPNGCGKSNVLDALRWVLGEQALSKLRCARSEDLVFAGSSRLAEQGYAEVSLVIENQGEVPELASELELRRRFYRSGESRFYINRQECRLKEIESLLRGGASGGRLYSVFDSAKLAEIVGGELGNLMESAAGVLGFRQKRKEAVGKLELVERDLLRLEDIIGERKRMVRSLARQRRRARVYAQLDSELAGLEAKKVRGRLNALQKDIQAKEKVIAEVEASQRDLVLGARDLEERLAEKDRLLDEVLAKERKARSSLDETAGKLSDAASRLSAARTRIQALEENLSRLSAQTSQAAQRLSEIGEEKEGLESELTQAKNERKNAEEELARARKERSEDEERLARLRLELREVRNKAKELSLELSELRQERIRQHSTGENARAFAGTAAEELERATQQSKQIKQNLQKIETGAKKADQVLEKTRTELSKKGKREAELASGIGKAEEEHRSLLEQESRLAGEAASLEHKIQDKPGQVLKNRLGARFKGMVEEMVSYPPGLEAALEAVLYDVVGFAAASGVPALRDLKLKGQAGAVTDRKLKSQPPSRPQDPGFRGWLRDQVRLKPGAPAMLSARLANWVVVGESDLVPLSKKYPDLSFVATTGTAVRSDGLMLVGRPAGALADRRRLKEIKENIEKTRQRLEKVEEKLASWRTERDELSKKLAELKARYLEEQSRTQGLKAQTQRLQDQVAELEAEKDRLRHERDSRKTQAEKAEEKAAELGEQITQLQTELAREEESLGEREEDLARAEEELRGKLAGLNQMILALGKAEERQARAADKMDRLDKEQSRLDNLTASHQEESGRIKDEISRLEAEVGELMRTQTALAERRKKIEERLAGMDTSQILSEKSLLQEELRQKNSDLEEVRGRLVQHRTDVLLLVRERDELGPLAQPRKEEAQDSEEELSLEEIEEKIAEKRHRLAELGPVNEYAAVQYQEEKEELDKLKAQKEDIIKASESLSEVIAEIDSEARSRFESTFTAVREEFRRTFNFFFPGGQADLKLADPQDPFNSSIDITARPEGKQLKRLSQLSDGERTMLGISLLFAFYGVRPAPFLFVDELDAPLDDANVLKFASYLSHIKDRIQVFVITHNKRTMEKADTIYGITMEEPGVSRIISVRLKDARRQRVGVEET